MCQRTTSSVSLTSDSQKPQLKKKGVRPTTFVHFGFPSSGYRIRSHGYPHSYLIHTNSAPYMMSTIRHHIQNNARQTASASKGKPHFVRSCFGEWGSRPCLQLPSSRVWRRLAMRQGSHTGMCYLGVMWVVWACMVACRGESMLNHQGWVWGPTERVGDIQGWGGGGLDILH